MQERCTDIGTSGVYPPWQWYANNRPRRLTVPRQFFRFARTRRLVLVDPTLGLDQKQLTGFRGETLAIDRLHRASPRSSRRILALLHDTSSLGSATAASASFANGS